MKGYLFDGTVPLRLPFSPMLPIIPLSNVYADRLEGIGWYPFQI